MKTPAQEFTDILIANSGNRLTPELIAGMQARFHHVLERALKDQSNQKQSENEND
ncbi:hypothetical protein [Vibrio anguillarum]|uniref:hypothetical protein n=1 Tax=Vibrio anguillarum TaxID=55601 RepID=UPI001AD8110C|nr:hypothetical protein [Vibrio anguillarum]MBT2965622.1 hypothetical protein [Vibrio anguillarum]